MNSNKERKLSPDAAISDVLYSLAQELVNTELKYELEYGDGDPAGCQKKMERVFAQAGIASPWAAPSAPPPTATALTTTPSPVVFARKHLDDAREIAGLGMAHHFLGLARLQMSAILTLNLDLAAQIQSEIDECAQYVTDVERANATLAEPVRVAA